MATTLNQIRTNVTAILGLDNSTSGDQPQIDYYANEAIRKVLIDTRCYVTSTSISPTTADYTLATSILEIIDLYVTSGGSNYILEPRSMDEILHYRRASTSMAGPTRYYHLAGNNLMMFYPTPVSGDSITMYYVPLPTEMSNSGHDATSATYGGIPVEMFDLIENYVLWKMADLDDDDSSGMGEKYFQLYEMGVQRARKHLRKKSGYRLSPARLRRRGYVPVNPSTSPATYG